MPQSTLFCLFCYCLWFFLLGWLLMRNATLSCITFPWMNIRALWSFQAVGVKFLCQFVTQPQPWTLPASQSPYISSVSQPCIANICQPNLNITEGLHQILSSNLAMSEDGHHPSPALSPSPLSSSQFVWPLHPLLASCLSFSFVIILCGHGKGMLRFSLTECCCVKSQCYSAITVTSYLHNETKGHM